MAGWGIPPKKKHGIPLIRGLSGNLSRKRQSFHPNIPVSCARGSESVSTSDPPKVRRSLCAQAACDMSSANLANLLGNPGDCFNPTGPRWLCLCPWVPQDPVIYHIPWSQLDMARSRFRDTQVEISHLTDYGPGCPRADLKVQRFLAQGCYNML